MTDWLLGTLLATSALILLVLVVREPVRHRFGSRVAYGLWLIPAMRLLMPSLTRTVERPASDSGPVSGLVPQEMSEPQLLASAAPDPSLIDQLGGVSTVLMTIWLGVALGFFLRGMLAFRRERTTILASAVVLARLGSIRIVSSPEVRGPLAFGIFDRVVAVPVDFFLRFGDRERRLALDHEIAHHRSGDLIANAFAFVLLCLQWFNPLAWVAHKTFRFDQEAACDARVLDKAGARDRVDYGRAIAKAASGRALLFTSALDRPSTLSRRLAIMANGANPSIRKVGFTLVGGTILMALPLTATWAVDYVDVAPSAALAPSAQAQPAAFPKTIAAAAPVPVASMNTALAAVAPGASAQEREDGTVTLPGGVTLGKGSVAFFADDSVVINGKIKRLEQLTSAERSKLRAVIAKSRRELEQDRAELPARLAEARREAERIRSGEFKRDLMNDREDLRRDLAEIDSEAADLRASGEDPEKLKAEIRRSLREAEAIDIDREAREALDDANPDKIIAELRSEEEQMVRMQARLDQLDRARN